MERRGLWPVVLLFAGAVPLVALIGYAAATSVWLLIPVVTLAGFCTLGLQFGLNAASAMIYPTTVRSNGSGWAFGVGRFGSILGPIFGGKLIALELSVPTVFFIAAGPFVVGTLACIALATLYAATFRGVGLGERGMAASPVREAV
jgi:AAHS family 4-hydroxybenzoate transporter-like MFS transporter